MQLIKQVWTISEDVDKTTLTQDVTRCEVYQHHHTGKFAVFVEWRRYGPNGDHKSISQRNLTGWRYKSESSAIKAAESVQVNYETNP